MVTLEKFFKDVLMIILLFDTRNKTCSETVEKNNSKEELVIGDKFYEMSVMQRDIFRTFILSPPLLRRISSRVSESLKRILKLHPPKRIGDLLLFPSRHWTLKFISL
ncbi:hypothetical protein CEXT_654451 [Caerostris extrusa]|uniref:Uncharacterized protein n=1 Tax=Caerostris extrusa TaxID=172846 RepID=A0AAV4TTW9_CAEEX|nr:hypothetical protein CEXT_654451 [Caerostris extrusa]